MQGLAFDPSVGYAVPLSSEVDAVNTVAASGAALTLPDPSVAPISRITLSAACTITFPTAVAGRTIRVVCKQDATGSRLVTWDAAVKWPGGTAPTLSTAAAKVDQFSFVCSDGATWAGKTDGLDLR